MDNLKENSRKELGNADTNPHRGGAHVLFLVVVGMIFLAFTVVFLFFPRSEYSELEKRDLATFPSLDSIGHNPSKLTADISRWFSDSEPYRDHFMGMSMTFRDALKFRPGGEEEAISFKPAAQDEKMPETEEAPEEVAQGNPMANANAKLANSGIIVVGTGKDVRALMAYGGTGKMGEGYIKAVNAYQEAFPEVNVYALVIPTSTEFYLPDRASKLSKPQRPTIDHVKENISPKVKFVDVHSILAAHTKEDIYLRTDHHWAPLGAFYAAKALAREAGVPFKEIDSYDSHVIQNFVGSMYGYSKDISVKNAPEDFIYYTPKNLNPQTSYITYHTDKNYNVVSQKGPYIDSFFKQYPQGSSQAYMTFMGGDSQIVKVKTGSPGNRRLLIIKDSFGNPIPSFLFYSFDEVHVVDFRYFKKNMKQYVADNKITDIALAFNVFNVCSGSAMDKVRVFLTQEGDAFSPS